MLKDSQVMAVLPAKDIDRAREFYSVVFGLTQAQIFSLLLMAIGAWRLVAQSALPARESRSLPRSAGR